jgi:DivIVA domain-containing protein
MTLRSSNCARLTPAYVHSMSFRLARLGRRGLDEDDVRDFCARVETEPVHLLEERAALFAELRRRPATRPAARPPAAAAPPRAGLCPPRVFPLRAVPGGACSRRSGQTPGNVHVT